MNITTYGVPSNYVPKDILDTLEQIVDRLKPLSPLHEQHLSVLVSSDKHVMNLALQITVDKEGHVTVVVPRGR
jgi:hypothetical protein